LKLLEDINPSLNLDDEGMVKSANLVVATTNNVPAISMSIRDAAKHLIQNGNVTDGLLNMVEMSFRAYDPCFGCASHFAVGQMPLTVELYDHTKTLVKTIFR